MDPITIALIASAAAPAVAGLAGHFLSAGDRAEAERLEREAYDELVRTGTPPDAASQQIALAKYQAFGEFTPELEEAIAAGPSRLEEIKIDPRLREAQMNALSKLQQVGTEGLTAEDRSVLGELRRSTARDVQSQQQATLQQMAQRGVSGSGAELAAQLAASQAGAERAFKGGEDVAAMAQKRALEAMMSSGELGGKIRGQEFEEEATKAKAADLMKQFDIENQRAVQMRNIGSKNLATKQQLDYERAIQEANIKAEQEEEKHNKTLARQYWQDMMDRAKILSGGKQAMAQGRRQSAASTMGAASSIGTGAAVGAAGVAQYMRQTPSTNTPSTPTPSQIQAETVSTPRVMSDQIYDKRLMFGRQ